MKKISFFILVMAFSPFVRAQLHVGSTTQPNSTLQIDGSIAAAFDTFSTSGTVNLDSSMRMVYANNASSTINFVLPNPATCTGREYIIKSTSSTNTLTVSGGGTINTINRGPGVTSYALPGEEGSVSFIAGTTTWEQITNNPNVFTNVFLYLRASGNTSYTATSTIQPVNLAIVVYNSGDFQYNTATNTITILTSGVYKASFQTSWASTAAGQQMTAGLSDATTGQWIARGTNFGAAATTTVGQLHSIDCPVTLTAGQTVRFSVASPQTATIVGIESGTSGTGIVTNASLQKINN